MLKVKLLNENSRVPKRNTKEDAGLDLSSIESVVIPPKTRKMIQTGISISLPEGTYGQIAPRSGLALKYGIQILAGIIDRNYTGEICVILYNSSDEDFVVNIYDRIAQLIIVNISFPEIIQVDELDNTERSSRGFGSSGIN